MSITVGLCESCRFHSLIVSDKGTEFHLCEKSKTDSTFPKYPQLPVKECNGFQTAKSAKERNE